MTRGTGASKPAHTYASRFFQLLNASFPHRWVLMSVHSNSRPLLAYRP